jgi:acyl-CoA reductase-like NAD-dependent aldehyde dehydrogenase
MALQVKPGTSWDEVYARARSAAPEAFDADRILNLVGGDWQRIGEPGEHVNPVDGAAVQGPPRVSHDEAASAVAHALGEHKAWGEVDLDERKRRVQSAVDGCGERDTLALLLAWEIGKPWKLACADVDRRSTASAGTSARSTASCRAARRCPGRSATSRRGTTR